MESVTFLFQRFPWTSSPAKPGWNEQTDTSSGTQELAAAVDDLLDQLQHKFDSVSNEILGKRKYTHNVYIVWATC